MVTGGSTENVALSTGVQALTRGLRVLEVISEQTQPIGVGELSRAVGLPKSTVQRILGTLASAGWVMSVPGPVTQWTLSSRMLAVGRRGTRSRDLREISLPHIRALGERSEETIHLSVLDKDRSIVLIDRVDSVHAVRTFNPIGANSPFHATSSGKAIMAALPDSEVDEILGRPLEKIMSSTIVDLPTLHQQILDARRLGYAVNIRENRPHVCAIAAAVTDASGRPVGAVAISMPDVRFIPERVSEWGTWVVETTRTINDLISDQLSR